MGGRRCFITRGAFGHGLLTRGTTVALSVAFYDMLQLTHDTRHLTGDTWHFTPDTWHLTCDIWHLSSDIWHLTRGCSLCCCFSDMWQLTGDTLHLTTDIWQVKCEHDTWHVTPNTLQVTHNTWLWVGSLAPSVAITVIRVFLSVTCIIRAFICHTSDSNKDPYKLNEDPYYCNEDSFTSFHTNDDFLTLLTL